MPGLIIPDNLKAAAAKVRRYESSLNKSYQETAGYYRTAVLPTRVRPLRDKRPQDKGVKIVRRRVMAVQRNRRFHSFSDLRREALAALRRVNERPFRKPPESRREHMPKNRRAMADRTPQRFSSRVLKIGKQMEAYIIRLMEQREQPEQAFKTCTAVLHMADTQNTAVMEQAAERAAGRINV